jgi:hypothetical protein
VSNPTVETFNVNPANATENVRPLCVSNEKKLAPFLTGDGRRIALTLSGAEISYMTT